MLTLDVSNAFNTAPWEKIMEALGKKDVPHYLRGIKGSYLNNRKILHTLNGTTREFSVERGVPQGSLLGPCLWNVMFDSLLRLELPSDVEIIAFADDVAVIATAKHCCDLEEKLEETYELVDTWMRNHGLYLAEQKTEAIVFTGRYKDNSMRGHCGNTVITSKDSVKYLGVHTDRKLRYKEHATITAKKATETVRQMGYILPNVGSATQGRRRLMATVVTSKLLYGAPCWHQDMTEMAWRKLEAVYRRMSIITASAYRTISHDAIGVIASAAPFRVKAKIRSDGYNRQNKEKTRRQAEEKWQEDWTAAKSGKWTRRLIHLTFPFPPNTIPLWPWCIWGISTQVQNKKHGQVPIMFERQRQRRTRSIQLRCMARYP